MAERLTDEQFTELLHAIPLLYQGGSLEEDFSPWAREWIGPDGGVLSLLNALVAERERAHRIAAELYDMQRRVALVRGMHRVGRD